MKDTFIRAYKPFDKDFCERVIENFEYNSRLGCTNVRRDGFRQDSQQDFNDTFHKSSQQLDFRHSELAEEFFLGLAPSIGDYISELGIQDTISPINFKNMIVQRTESDKFEQYSAYHCEAEHLGVCDRAIVYMLYLNDNFEGGETEFRFQQHKEIPEQGKLVIWPAGYTHTHRGAMLLSGSKYIANGWAFFTELKTIG